ncbi:Phosphofructokinase [Artemisia annua]|uniref:Phosphofructokinase n=1 Tax=Artemisia annua TaxID=35608 RepID=A0A2U1MST9_ARTAN|nr:Phosphofructokinase [Artemisia annua]
MTLNFNQGLFGQGYLISQVRTYLDEGMDTDWMVHFSVMNICQRSGGVHMVGICGIWATVRELFDGVDMQLLEKEVNQSSTLLALYCRGYRGFYSKNTITLTPKFMNEIHKRRGTIIGTSQGGHDKPKIVDSIQDCSINQVIHKSFGFNTAVKDTQSVITAAHVEAESAENGIGVSNLWGATVKHLKNNGHMVIVVAEGAGKELLAAETLKTSTALHAHYS